MGYHPTDVIVLSIGHYAEVMIFNDYEYQLSKLDKEGSSFSGALQDEQDKPDVKELVQNYMKPNQKRSRAAIQQRQWLYKQRKQQRDIY